MSNLHFSRKQRHAPLLAGRRKLHPGNEGFTVVELLISTAVFATVLLLCATAIVQVGRMFYKGVTINRTQDTTRLAMEDITQAIQFGDTSVGFYQTFTGGGVEARCLGRVRYTFTTTQSLGTIAPQSRHVLWKDRIAANATCGTALPSLNSATPSANGQELVGENMRVPVLNITPPVLPGKIWLLTLTISYGDTDNLFVPASNFTECVRRSAGGQFCTVSSITTSILKRL